MAVVAQQQLLVPLPHSRRTSITSVQLMVDLFDDVRRSPSSYQKLDGCNREEHIELDDDATNAAIDDDDDDDGGGVRRSGDARGYGIAFTSPETVRHQFSARKRLVLIRIKICNWSLVLALIGLLFAMIDTELIACKSLRIAKTDLLSLLLRWMVVLTTIALDICILGYHLVEVKIALVESGNVYWRVGVTSDRIVKLVTELFICSICPIPGSGYVSWPLLGATPTYERIELPIDVLLCLFMFNRSYILCRFMVLHSIQFQDAATRTIAVLNQISVDFPFVIKTMLNERPLMLICIFTGSFWIIMAWCLTQCERYTDMNAPQWFHLLNFFWFEVVTFLSIGYGETMVHTYCGRALAITTGIVGAFMSSLIIALVGIRMQLSLSERRVNQVIAESQLGTSFKQLAATVLQNSWRLHRCRRQMSNAMKPTLKLRLRQKKLLISIIAFRRIRWRLRMRIEHEDEEVTFRRSFRETQERIFELRKRQNQLRTQLSYLTINVDQLGSMLTGASIKR